MEYIIILYISLILFIFNYLKMNRISLFLEFIFLLILIIFIGGRGDIEPDYLNYKDIYVKSISSIEVLVESGYYNLNKIFGNIGLKFEFLLILLATISIVLKYKFFKKNSKYYMLMLYIYISTYLFFQEFIQIRQAIAISILILSYKYVLEKKLLKFLIVILMASFFHIGSLIFITIYILWNTKIRDIISNHFFIILLISLLVKNIFEIIFLNYSSYMPYYSKIEIYLKEKVQVFPYRIILFSIIFNFIESKLKNKFNEMDKLIFFIFKCGVIFCLLMINLGDISFRLRIYFLWLECYIVAKVFENLNLGKLKIIVIILMSLLYLRIFTKFLENQMDRGYFIPYKNTLLQLKENYE